MTSHPGVPPPRRRTLRTMSDITLHCHFTLEDGPRKPRAFARRRDARTESGRFHRPPGLDRARLSPVPTLPVAAGDQPALSCCRQAVGLVRAFARVLSYGRVRVEARTILVRQSRLDSLRSASFWLTAFHGLTTAEIARRRFHMPLRHARHGTVPWHPPCLSSATAVNPVLGGDIIFTGAHVAS